uniref:Uncharacterized protein n=1 Tax=Arundo donax TaxID=35708 RepID=A0A0A9DWP3_ARUDO
MACGLSPFLTPSSTKPLYTGPNPPSPRKLPETNPRVAARSSDTLNTCRFEPTSDTDRSWSAAPLRSVNDSRPPPPPGRTFLCLSPVPPSPPPRHPPSSNLHADVVLVLIAPHPECNGKAAWDSLCARAATRVARRDRPRWKRKRRSS